MKKRNYSRLADDLSGQSRLMSLSEIASIMGKLGGASKSASKKAASRNNGRKGGRPKKVKG